MLSALVKIKIEAWIPGPEWDKRREGNVRPRPSVAWRRQSTRGSRLLPLLRMRAQRATLFVLGGRHFLRPSVSCGFGKVPSPPHGTKGGTLGSVELRSQILLILYSDYRLSDKCALHVERVIITVNKQTFNIPYLSPASPSIVTVSKVPDVKQHVLNPISV